jgi:hypothetical protein
MLKTLTTAAFAGSLVFLVHSAPGPPPAGAIRHIRFTNDTREPIVELHVAAAGTGNWQDDLLGPDYLMPGKSLVVAIADPDEACRADLKMVLDDGTERFSRAVDLCRDTGRAMARR